jgi:uncharacterized protein YbjT (DUF2867 family)
MSEPHRVLLVGATGLVGTRVMEQCVDREDYRLLALSRREAPLPKGARMEMMVADLEGWERAIADLRPEAVVCALGTTWRKADRDETAFRAVDEGLVLRVARAALAQGARNFVFVSSVGADPYSRVLYLRVKGEVERELRKLGFHRLDVLRPGLLRGPRDGDWRPGERLAKLLSPLTDLFLHGRRRRYRSIDARTVARAALQCAKMRPGGKFAAEHDFIKLAARHFVERT